MGAPLFAELFLFCYQRDFIEHVARHDSNGCYIVDDAWGVIEESYSSALLFCCGSIWYISDK